MQSVEIYGLYCPDTGAIRYIGKANNTGERFKSHLRDSRKRKTPVYRWISGLLEQSKEPICEVLAVVPAEKWENAEIDIIHQARTDGCDLLNVAKGGNEPKRRTDRLGQLIHKLGIFLHHGHCTDATKAKMRFAANKHPHIFPAKWAAL